MLKYRRNVHSAGSKKCWNIIEMQANILAMPSEDSWTCESVSDETRRLMMFKIYQEESGHQIYVRCQMFSWRARAVSRMDSYIILITKLLEDIVAKETEDASTVKIFPKWVPARLLSANVHKHFHLCVHFYFVCISIVIQHFFFACISIVLQHFFYAYFLCISTLLHISTV